MDSESIVKIKIYLQNKQQQLCQALEQTDGGAKFFRDRWQRQQGGGGISCVLSNGRIFERAGINYSHINGDSMPASATVHRPELAGRSFQAMGLSLVVHPQNPFVPTSHANIRFFIAEQAGEKPVWWFGGGYDLTPYYAFDEDCVHWHRTAYEACKSFGDDVYPQYKQWCDEYFFLKHRNETRGIGGVFFDDLNCWDFDTCFAFLRSIGDSWMDAYIPIVEKRHQTSFSAKERDFQLYRRGRYVEFNLVYDRGTLFGLQTGGRTESILMSLPPTAVWRYDWRPEPGSKEEQLYLNYLHPRDWLNVSD